MGVIKKIKSGENKYRNLNFEDNYVKEGKLISYRSIPTDSDYIYLGVRNIEAGSDDSSADILHYVLLISLTICLFVLI